jgi:hypothetical protein
VRRIRSWELPSAAPGIRSFLLCRPEAMTRSHLALDSRHRCNRGPTYSSSLRPLAARTVTGKMVVASGARIQNSIGPAKRHFDFSTIPGIRVNDRKLVAKVKTIPGDVAT